MTMHGFALNVSPDMKQESEFDFNFVLYATAAIFMHVYTIIFWNSVGIVHMRLLC